MQHSNPHTPSRSNTPNLSLLKTPQEPGTAIFQHSPESRKLEKEYEAGCLPDEVYEKVLSRWRANLRAGLVKSLRVESEYMAAMQARIRGPFLDRYFYWTALLGTHTFFMAGLPMFFWFGGNDARARGLLMVTGLGIWISSFVKDLACCPRPFSPPVIRLSMSTHGLEYGFPSSHSANTVSIALFISDWLHDQFELGAFDAQRFFLFKIGLAIYGVSVILGRMYCGMHSIIDCSAGALMGWGCWYFWRVAQVPFESWAAENGLHVPLFGVVVCLFLVHYHPEPVDDCPCFEDAIAFLSVMLGSFLSHWFNSHYRPNFTHGFPVGVTPFGLQGTAKTGALIVLNLLKVVIGISALFTWRMVMKRILHSALPVIFRAASKVFHFALPTRKHYKAATDYETVPTPHTMNPLPSFVDLPSQGSLTSALPPAVRLHKRARQTSTESTASNVSIVSQESIEGIKRRPMEAKKHYDVDVLTKVVVYCGIPIIAIDPVRVVFVILEKAIGRAA